MGCEGGRDTRVLVPAAARACSASDESGSSSMARFAAATMSIRSSPIEPDIDSKSLFLRTAWIAAVTAPHFVWPAITRSFVCKRVTEYSADPRSEPWLCGHVFPALRSTNRSPGRMSNKISMGARESAQPMTIDTGFCPPSLNCGNAVVG